MTPPSRFRVPLHLQELIRGLHPDLKRKVRGLIDLIAIGPRRIIYEETLRLLRHARRP